MSSQAIALRHLFPLLYWWPMVNRDNLKSDLMAGFTGAVAVLPQGVAFATIAGMPPEYGIYAGIVPAIIAALFGSSWHLVSGPTTAASIVIFSVLSPHAEPGSTHYVQLALTLTFMVGLIQLGLGMARLGVLVNFISHSVVIGFTAGAAILIATNQVKHFTGLTIPRGASFSETWILVMQHLTEANLTLIAIGTVTLLSGIITKRFFPKLPYMIVALLAGSILGVVLSHLNPKVAISTVGALPISLPPLSAPLFSLNAFRELSTGALAVALLALTEAVSIARALGVRSGQNINGNQEFIGQGLSNLFGCFFSSYVATGSFNRSGLNYASGAKSPMASIFSGVMLPPILLLVGPWINYMPNAAMAGILFLVAWGLIDLHHIAQILRSEAAEKIILITTFTGTILLDLEVAILVGVFLSLTFYLARTSRPRVLFGVPDAQCPVRSFSTEPYVTECPQLRIARVDGSLFFAAVDHVRESLQQGCGDVKHLAIIASGINFVDLAGAEFLAREAHRRRQQGGGLYIIGAKDQVWEILAKGGYLDILGSNNMFQTKGVAIRLIHEKLRHEQCQICDKKIFLECLGQTNQDQLQSNLSNTQSTHH
ncbi:MAG: SulP family inorganic anion transporter [Magnetococcales bacterium]|nr:SulP family inorganic anion transporter [Magnetococcales bacterium]